MHSLIVVALVVCVSCSAWAADRYFCASIKFKDRRSSCTNRCIGSEHEVGRVDPCESGTDRFVAHIPLQLWDRDPGGTDEYIGTFLVESRGVSCFVFPWEGERYQTVDNETDPDPYVRLVDWYWEYGGQRLYVMQHVVPGNMITPPSVSWQSSYYSNCPENVLCWDPYETLFVSSDPGSLENVLFNLGDTSIHAYYAFSSRIPEPFYMRYLEDANTCVFSSSSVIISENSSLKPDVPTHEIGHLIHHQNIADKSFGSVDYSLSGNGHGLISQEYDRAATCEGWANYVAARSWWNPDNSSAMPCAFGYEIEDQTPPPGLTTLAENRGLELWAARGFWDLDDAAQDSGQSPCYEIIDTTNLSTTDIVDIWSVFPSGADDREAQEDGVNGTNLYDYYVNGALSDYDVDGNVLINMQCQTLMELF